MGLKIKSFDVGKKELSLKVVRAWSFSVQGVAKAISKLKKKKKREKVKVLIW